MKEKRELLLQLVNGALLDIDPGDKIRISHEPGAMRKSSKNILHRCQDIVGKDVAIEFVKDNKLSDGQCKIETPYGVVDCGVDTQLSALAEGYTFNWYKRETNLVKEAEKYLQLMVPPVLLRVMEK